MSVKKTPQLGRFFILKCAYLLAFASLAIGWLSPMHVQPWVSWHSEVPVFFGVFSALGLVLLSRRDRHAKVSLPQPAWLAVVLLLLTLLHWILGHIPYVGDVWIVLFYIALALACVGLGHAAAAVTTGGQTGRLSLIDKPATMLAWTMLLIGIASASAGLVQTFDVWTHSDWFSRPPASWRPGGQVGQANHFAIGLLMALVSAVYLLTIRQLGAVTAVIVVIFLGLGIAISHSRTTFLCVVILGVWWTYKQPLIAPLHRLWWGPAATLMLTCQFLLWPTVYNEFYMLAGAESARLHAGSLRFLVWPQLFDAVLARPWLGWGTLQVAPAHNSVLHNSEVSEAYTYGHNILLDVAIWLGIPAALLFFAAAAVWLWHRARAVKGPQSWYLFSLMLPVGVGSLMEFPYVYAYCLAPALFAVGMLERELRCKPILQLPIRAALAPYALVAGLMAWSAVEYIKVEEDVRVARFEALRVGKTADGYAVPNIVLLTQLSSLAASTRIAPMPGLSKVQMDLLRNAALRYPWPATGFRYVTALALNGNQPEALRQMQIMRAIQGDKTYKALMDVLFERLAEHQVPWRPQQPLVQATANK